MARKLWTVTAALALLAVVGKFYAKPVLAQVRAALVQNVDEPGRNTFGLAKSNFTLNPYFASFTVPAGQRYIVEQYSATCDVVSTTSLSQVEIDTVSGGVQVFTSSPAHVVQVNGFVGGQQVYNYEASGLGPAYADPGTTITLFANAVAGTGGTNIKDCYFSIQGHYVTP
jgi:hypothetical protein